MTPPDRVSEPVSLSGAPIASRSNDDAQGDPVDLGRPGRARHDDAGDDPDAVDRDRLRAGVAQLVDQLLDPVAVDRAADRDRRRPGRRPGRARRRPGSARRSAVISSTDASPRDRFACRVVSSVSSVDDSVRNWSLRALRLATRTVRSCDDSWARPDRAGLRAELDDDQDPEDDRDGGDRELARSSVHVSRPVSRQERPRARSRARRAVASSAA